MRKVFHHFMRFSLFNLSKIEENYSDATRAEGFAEKFLKSKLFNSEADESKFYKLYCVEAEIAKLFEKNYRFSLLGNLEKTLFLVYLLTKNIKSSIQKRKLKLRNLTEYGKLEQKLILKKNEIQNYLQVLQSEISALEKEAENLSLSSEKNVNEASEKIDGNETNINK